MRLLIIALGSLGLTFGVAFVAARLRSTLPGHRFNETARDLVSAGARFARGFAALVLSLSSWPSGAFRDASFPRTPKTALYR